MINKPTAAKHHFITGLDTQPMHRICGREMSNMLDVVLSESDLILAVDLQKHKKGRLLSFIPYSMTVIYGDEEQDPYEYSGFITTYHSHYPELGHPTVHCYLLDHCICWTGKDTARAEAIRNSYSLRRYRLYTRYTNYWEYSHAGQLPLVAVKVKY